MSRFKIKVKMDITLQGDIDLYKIHNVEIPEDKIRRVRNLVVEDAVENWIVDGEGLSIRPSDDYVEIVEGAGAVYMEDILSIEDLTHELEEVA